ncbi:hypothetical protein AAVH_24788 [Aphelenchoides avenae]|nr:hypothetical protein AAVH_24788 [Aphelenchus avenae]
MTTAGLYVVGRMQALLLPSAEAFRFAVGTLDNVTTIKNDSWTCEEQTTTPITTSTSERPDNNTNAYGTSGVTENDTGNQTTLRTPTLQEATNAALEEHGGISDKMALADRITMHQKIADAIFLELNKSADSSVAFQVLVYLPLEKAATDKHCLRTPNVSSIVGYNEKGVNYFVHSYPAVRNHSVADLWENIRTKEADIVDAVLQVLA